MAERVIRSEVAGTVWKIVAEVGQSLSAQDQVLILESMKMEIPVAAPVAGTLKRLEVAEGEVIAEDQKLAVIEV